MAALRLPLGLPGIDPGLGLLGTTLGGIRTRTRTRRTTLPRIDPLLRIRGVGRGVAGTTGGSLDRTSGLPRIDPLLRVGGVGNGVAGTGGGFGGC